MSLQFEGWETQTVDNEPVFAYQTCVSFILSLCLSYGASSRIRVKDSPALDLRLYGSDIEIVFWYVTPYNLVGTDRHF